MLLTLATSYEPATDLGYLLHKHPERVQKFELAFGTAHVFYPEATAQRCEVAMLLDVDPISLVRGRARTGRNATGPLANYVNDRPYAASSLTSVAISKVFGTALGGTCKTRPDLVDRALPFEVRVAVVPSRGGEGVLHRLFEPLGYEVEVDRHPLDENFPDWGDSAYYTLSLRHEVTVRELLAHLYVLLPVLDDDKHYYIGEDEVKKLLKHGEGWLASHPAKEEIALRYLRRQRSLARLALERLREEDEGEREEAERDEGGGEKRLEKPMRLNEVRLGAVADRLRGLGVRRIVDLGCGEGRLVQLLLRDKLFTRVVGLDTSVRTLEIAAGRLHLEEMAPRMRERVDLLHGSLTYRDERIEGFDAATLVEVIEHVDLERLPALERVVFEYARPANVVVTTPNAEYNVRFEGLSAGSFRHSDHRFEWTRSEFTAWCTAVADRRGYGVDFTPIGEQDPEVGAPTQMATFRR